MALKNQKFFQQKIGGKTILEIIRELTYSSDKVDDRLSEVKSLLESEEFFIEYLTNHYTASINAGDVLSHEINVFSAIETLASYILNSKEVKKKDDSEVSKYTFITDRKYFDKKNNRESTSSETGEAMVFLKRPAKNYKKSKDIVISKEDLKRDDELGEVLRAYTSYLSFINSELAKFKKDSPIKPTHSRMKLTKIKGQILDDMTITKRSYTGLWGEDLRNFAEGSVPDYSKIDLTRVDHLYGFEEEISHPNKEGEYVIKHTPGLLFLENNYECGTDLHILFMMLDDAISKTPFIGNQKEVLTLSQLGYSTKMIADKLDIDHQNVNRTLKSAAVRIAKTCIELNYGVDEE